MATRWCKGSTAGGVIATATRWCTGSTAGEVIVIVARRCTASTAGAVNVTVMQCYRAKAGIDFKVPSATEATDARAEIKFK